MTLSGMGAGIARSALKEERIPLGPWEGSMRSRTADMVPRTHTANGKNFLYHPRTGRFKRRNGQNIQFDDISDIAGLLPATWGARGRQMEEFVSSSVLDGVPTLCALATKELAEGAADTGRFSNFWLRDQVNDSNYTIGSEFGDSTYPDPGDPQTYWVVPLYYRSGDGGIARGVTEFQRRFFFPGSRKFLQVGQDTYFPSLDGTPSRWNSQFGGPAQAFTTNGEFDSSWGLVGANASVALATDDGDTTLVQSQAPGSAVVAACRISLAIPTGVTTYTGWKLHFVARMAGAGTIPSDAIGITKNATYNSGGSPGAKFAGGSTVKDLGNDWLNSRVQGHSSYDTYTYDFTEAEALSISTATRVHIEMLSNGFTGSGSAVYNITHIYIETPASGSAGVAGVHLMPSGPIRPTHAGVLVKGSTFGGANAIKPDGDVTNQLSVLLTPIWRNESSTTVDLYKSIDDEIQDDTTYVFAVIPPGFSGTLEVSLENPVTDPASTDVVTVRWRHQFAAGLDGTYVVKMYEGATLIATSPTFSYVSSGQWLNQDFDLTDAERDSVVDWTNVRLRFVATSPSPLGSSNEFNISYMKLTFAPEGVTLGGWKGSDRFYYTVAYRWKDGSVWSYTDPRAPNSLLVDGYSLFTVDKDNPDANFDKITWTHIPVGPPGVDARYLLRCPKIDSANISNLELDPTDMRIVKIIEDNVTTTYDDTSADDAALELDVSELQIRRDHIMPPPSRYIFGGDLRVCHSYGRASNPCAFELAPVGVSADYDRNLPIDTDSLYDLSACYFRIENTSDANTQLVLYKSDGVTNTVVATFAFSTYTTLEKLVDGINATNVATNGGQWRAQMCPGANPQADTRTSLVPHIRTIAGCTAAGTALTAASGLLKVAVGSLVEMSGVTAGTYIVSVQSDISATMSASGSGTGSCNFIQELGDAPTAALALKGYQRVIANSLPAFVYYNYTYLSTTQIDKSAIWMTTGSPNSNKAAANCFSGKLSNKHTPPLEAGISMGGAAVGSGFVVPFSKKRAIIVNTRDTGSGVDSDYKLIITNESSGCCSWSSITSGNQVVFMVAPEGVLAVSLKGERLVSKAVWRHPTSDDEEGIGDFLTEMPLSIAASGSDTDDSHFYARVVSSVLWLNFRVDDDDFPDRQLAYDFSSKDDEVSGLRAAVRPDGTEWGWSTPLYRSVSIMCEGRRDDGAHFYGWNDTGGDTDGRVDALETGDTDNNTAIVGFVDIPWIRDEVLHVAGRRIVVEHSSPTGAVASLAFVRGFTPDSYSFTPTTSSSLVVSRDVMVVPFGGAQVAAPACMLTWSQSSGPATEIRRMALLVAWVPAYN